MGSRKRGFDAVDVEEASQTPTLLDQIRNAWEFASLTQYIYIFGKAAKISDDIDVETLEMELAAPTHSQKLNDIGFALLKNVSSNTKLTLNDFDEYTRRQFVMKIPKRNPYGTEEEPLKFAEFDAFTKLRVLYQLSVWTLWNPDKVRYKVEEQDETTWRIEPFGWDSDDRTYFVLDDNRLYRKTDPPPPPPPKRKSKAKPKPKPKKTRGSRSSKRQKLANGEASDGDDEVEPEETEAPTPADEENGLGGAQWELIAITLEEYNEFLGSIRRSKDPNEKILVKRLTEGVLPLIEKEAEAQERRAAKKQKELENMQKMALAKRSSRLAGKQEKQREKEEAEEAERKKQLELAAARKELERQRKMEKDRESRMMTREQRLKDRDMRRLLNEQELAKLDGEKETEDNMEARISERNRKAEKEKRQRELDQIKEESEEWDFDCAKCGVHGRNLDDGTHIMACEKCGVWQHSACHGLTVEEAERDDFHFICATCSKPKVNTLKLRMSASESPKLEKQARTADVNGTTKPQLPPKGTLKGPPPSRPAVMVPSLYKPQQQHLQQSSPHQQQSSTYYQSGPYHSGNLQTIPKPQNPNHQADQRYLSHQPSPQKPQPSQYPYNPPAYQQPGPQHHHAQHNAHPLRPQYSPTSTLPSIRELTAPSNNEHGQNYSVHGEPNHTHNLQENPYHYSYQQHNTPHLHSNPTPQQAYWSHRPYPQSPSNPTTTPHNSYLNDFGRQRPSSAHSNQSFASPAPSLSATQGNTDVRFSPTQTGGSPNSHSYAPTTNRPALSGYSPTKHDSDHTPPMGPPQYQPHPSQSPNEHNTHQSPRFAPATTASAADSASFMRTDNNMPSHHAGFPSGNSISPQTGSSTSAPVYAPAPGPASGIQLPPIPSLSPSVNAGRQNLEPPVKKPTLEQPASMSPSMAVSSPDLNFPKAATSTMSPVAPVPDRNQEKTERRVFENMQAADRASPSQVGPPETPLQNLVNGHYGYNDTRT